uniref:non-specific serine/threonine protein kinase n=1 Tax=Nelumbo nucifera TaxID=4432 RepID=A0A822XLT3_NELNU|nr:TPA_asm: hypothetical protein HUJ06_021482 [Nelumbo nucifera]
MGRHPGEFLSSLSSSLSSNQADLLLKDVLDQRLEAPTGQLANKVVSVFTLALACTNGNPDSRPTMNFVAQELSSQTNSSISLNHLRLAQSH